MADDDKEKAEGDRDTVEEALRHEQAGQQGVTNHPQAEEEREQSKLPPRGEPKPE
jgi:hypothetical protein